MGNTPTETVQSLVRGFDVIRSFDDANARQSISSIARRSGLARPTARRFVRTLMDEGYIASDGTQYWLTPRILELGYSSVSQGIAEIGQHEIEKLANKLGVSVAMAMLEGSDMTYIAVAKAQTIMSISITPGTRFPAYATSMGRVMMAYVPTSRLSEHLPPGRLATFTSKTVRTRQQLAAELDTIRRQGWGMAIEELEYGLASIAVPIFDTTSKVVAALNASAADFDADGRNLVGFVPALRETSAAISAMAAHGDPTF